MSQSEQDTTNSGHQTPPHLTDKRHVVHYGEIRGENGREPLPSQCACSAMGVAVAGFSGGVSRCGACSTIKGLLLTEKRSSFRCATTGPLRDSNDPRSGAPPTSLG